MKTRTRYLLVAIGFCLGMTGCKAREPATVGLSGIVYNYSDETIAFVRVNGKEIGRGIDEAKPGEVKGGAVMCCFKLDEAASKADVQIILWDKSQYETTATIEKWWPDLAHYGVVHVLPGRKVVMEIRSVHAWQRKDLLEHELHAMGIKPTYDYSGPMNNGPMERTDGVE